MRTTHEGEVILNLQWYYADTSGAQQGPVSGDSLAAAYARGQVTASSLVWRAGLSEWSALSEMAHEVGLKFDRPAPESAFAAPPSPDSTSASSTTSSAEDSTRVSDEDLKRAYVGEKYVVFRDKWASSSKGVGFNVPAFLLGPIWYVYRKMYLYAAMILGSLVGLSVLEEMFGAPKNLSSAISWGCVATITILANYLYGRQVEAQVRRIRGNARTDRLLSDARLAGGTNLGGALIVALFIVVLVGLVLFDAIQTGGGGW